MFTKAAFTYLSSGVGTKVGGESEGLGHGEVCTHLGCVVVFCRDHGSKAVRFFVFNHVKTRIKVKVT